MSLRDDCDSVGLSDPCPLTPDPWSKATWRLEALRGLGLIHHGVGRELEAEGYLEQAVTLGHEIGLAPRKLVYLYHSLGDAVFWQQVKSEQLLRVGQAGLALVEDDPETVEAAMMTFLIAVGHMQGGVWEKGWDLIRRSVPFLERLPYSEELQSLYYFTLRMYSEEEDNVEETTRWLRIFEQKARQHNDLRGLGGDSISKAFAFYSRGATWREQSPCACKPWK